MTYCYTSSATDDLGSGKYAPCPCQLGGTRTRWALKMIEIQLCDLISFPEDHNTKVSERAAGAPGRHILSKHVREIGWSKSVTQ